MVDWIIQNLPQLQCRKRPAIQYHQTVASHEVQFPVSCVFESSTYFNAYVKSIKSILLDYKFTIYLLCKLFGTVVFDYTETKTKQTALQRKN